MDAIVKMLEKHQPFFEKISRNIYLQAIKDGFLGCMPIVLTSSIFLLIATLPGVVGITLPQPLIDWCNKLYNFTMGVMGIMVAGTTAKNFTASMNRRMPAGKVLNDGSTMVAAQCSMLLLAVTQFTTKFNGSELSVFDCTSMGTRGLFSAYIAAFITVWVYKFCVSRDLTIKLPKEVPGAIAQNFRDIIPFGGAVIICGIIDVIVRNLMGVPFSELLIKLLSPLFTAAETYPGLILIQAATAFFWFIGVHGPSIVQPGIDPIRLANQAENLQVLLAGGHPAHSLTFNMSLVGEFGGTGATFIVPLLLILFMKSKQLKAVGKASIVPVAFAVNEPLLFGAPMILNPYMLIPFVAAGCVNVSVAKFFIDNVGMNGFSFVVPWATPAPIGIFITTNFQLIALVFVAIIILLDAIIYLPFLKAYDKLLCDQEAERAAELGLESDGAAAIAANASAPAVEQATASVETTVAAADSKPVADQPEPAADASAKKDVDGLKVLVLCAGAGTSAMLANAIKEGAAQTGENIASSAGAYGQHTAIMDQYDVIVLAPQVRSYYNDMKADTDRLGIKLLARAVRNISTLLATPLAPLSGSARTSTSFLPLLVPGSPVRAPLPIRIPQKG